MKKGKKKIKRVANKTLLVTASLALVVGCAMIAKDSALPPEVIRDKSGHYIC